jgi:hypothetical protein
VANDPATGLPLDTEVTIKLSLSSWQIVLAHLSRGMHRDVAETYAAICRQGDPQLYAAMARTKPETQSAAASSTNEASVH